MFKNHFKNFMIITIFSTWGSQTAMRSSDALAKTNRQFQVFDITKEPNRKDWKRFIKQDPKKRQQMWNFYSRQSLKLGSWSWGWRIGWVRTCTFSREAYCATILKSALFDDAVVVRSEAAIQMGKRYENSQSAIVINLLAKAYDNHENFRRGKPLFVQNRILFAIKQVGGDSAIQTGTALARENRHANSYWQKIIKI